VEKVKALLQVLDAIQPCCGNSDGHFLAFTKVWCWINQVSLHVIAAIYWYYVYRKSVVAHISRRIISENVLGGAILWAIAPIWMCSSSISRDSTHYTPAKVGFSSEVDQQLIDAIDFSKEGNRYVALLLNDVHIKEDLVYDKHSGSFDWFCQHGWYQLTAFEKSLSNENAETKPSVASTMLVIMVRGLVSNLNFPYAQFPCGTWSGDLLVDPVWEAISRLERQGIRVLALTCDGVSANLLTAECGNFTPKVKEGCCTRFNPNTYATDQPWSIYSISDPPHLMKLLG